jgi:hypothetical protein
MIRAQDLEELVGKSWTAFKAVAEQPFVVRPSVPIPFFGDSGQYFASELKVLTVGLNPSKQEFPKENPFLRFPLAAPLADESVPYRPSNHLQALDAYFRREPYAPWFGSMESILNGLNASYYNVQTNTALHTDLCSPIATDPTWSKLSKGERSKLEQDGHSLWHLLVDLFEPDIILISIAKRYFEQIRFPCDVPQVIWELRRTNPYSVVGKWLRLTRDKASLVVFGRAANKPFGTVSRADKLKMGAAIKEWYRAAKK